MTRCAISSIRYTRRRVLSPKQSVAADYAHIGDPHGEPLDEKNPFLSMWLSGANAVAGKARSAGKAEAGRQQTGMIKQATRFWTGAWFAALKPKRRR